MALTNNHWVVKYIDEQPLYTEVCEHPYLRLFSSGARSEEHIRSCWFLQQAWLSRSFPMCIAEMLAKTPPRYLEETAALSNILRHEVWSPNPQQGHPVLFQQLHKLIKPDWSLLDLPSSLESTLHFVNERHHYLMKGNIYQALGCLIGNEYINADFGGKRGIMISYNIGLRKILKKELVAYTHAHVSGEEKEVKMLLRFVDKLFHEVEPCALEEKRRLIFEGVDHLLNLRIKFFDGLNRAC